MNLPGVRLGTKKYAFYTHTHVLYETIRIFVISCVVWWANHAKRAFCVTFSPNDASFYKNVDRSLQLRKQEVLYELLQKC